MKALWAKAPRSHPHQSPVQPPVPSPGLWGYQGLNGPPFCPPATLPTLGAHLSEEALSHCPALPSGLTYLTVPLPPRLLISSWGRGEGPGARSLVQQPLHASCVLGAAPFAAPPTPPPARPHLPMCSDSKLQIWSLWSEELCGGNGGPRLAPPRTPVGGTGLAFKPGCKSLSHLLTSFVSLSE